MDVDTWQSLPRRDPAVDEAVEPCDECEFADSHGMCTTTEGPEGCDRLAQAGGQEQADPPVQPNCDCKAERARLAELERSHYSTNRVRILAATRGSADKELWEAVQEIHAADPSEPSPDAQDEFRSPLAGYTARCGECGGDLAFDEDDLDLVLIVAPCDACAARHIQEGMEQGKLEASQPSPDAGALADATQLDAQLLAELREEAERSPASGYVEVAAANLLWILDELRRLSEPRVGSHVWVRAMRGMGIDTRVQTREPTEQEKTEAERLAMVWMRIPVHGAPEQADDLPRACTASRVIRCQHLAAEITCQLPGDQMCPGPDVGER